MANAGVTCVRFIYMYSFALCMYLIQHSLWEETLYVVDYLWEWEVNCVEQV